MLLHVCSRYIPFTCIFTPFRKELAAGQNTYKKNFVQSYIPFNYIPFCELSGIEPREVTARDFQDLAARIDNSLLANIFRTGHSVTLSFVFNGILTNNQ